jgi:sterol desaturase/sphingolipid hydroxylase (fatty acid hydroxylase superfamily)
MTWATSWILRVSESKSNYWGTYVVDLSLMTYFLVWDAARLRVSAAEIGALFVLGAFTWTLSEYAFHRWIYHLGFAITRNAHAKHHDDPTAYIAMPWFVTPLLFLPPQQLIGRWLGVHGFSSFLAGWFAGFIAYSFMHHSLHHYKLRFAWYRHLQSQHRIHHAFPETNFGVTMRVWDRVFRTEFTKAR